MNRKTNLAIAAAATVTNAAPAQAERPQHLQLVKDDQGRPQPRGRTIELTFQVHTDHAPALLAAVEEMTDMNGSRLSGQMLFARETALTAASIALAKLRAALYGAGLEPDPNYEAR